MPPAQFYNWCEVNFKMYLLNLGKPVEVPKLNENQAIELGANILGEGIIFVIAAAILVAEYIRQTNKEAVKEEAKLAEMRRICTAIDDLFFEGQKNSTEIKELTRHVHFLESELKKFPPPQPPAPPAPAKPRLMEPEEKDASPSNISYLHQQPTFSKKKIYRGVLRERSNQIHDVPIQDVPIKKSSSILAALNYLEDELLLGEKDNHIEEQSNGIIMDALDYLETDVFKNSSDNNVIFVLKNAPYASRFC